MFKTTGRYAAATIKANRARSLRTGTLNANLRLVGTNSAQFATRNKHGTNDVMFQDVNDFSCSVRR